VFIAPMDAKEKTEENGTKKFKQKIGETNRRENGTGAGGGEDYNMHGSRRITIAIGCEQRELERVVQQIT